jgi:uncharacterized RDD family membrane protein YckC
VSHPQEPAGPVNPAHPAYPTPYPAPVGPMVAPYAQAQALLVPLPPGVQLSSHGKRFGAWMLDGLLMLVTLGIGWLIWALIRYGDGQTPAKQLLDMRVFKADRMRVASWGEMFVRDILTRGLLLSLLTLVTCGIGWLFAVLMIFAGTARQTLWDKICNTMVVDDPYRVLAQLPQQR